MRESLFLDSMSGDPMPKPYSGDLRARVIGDIVSGASRRAAAEYYGISPSVVMIWAQRFETTGSVAAKPSGGSTSPLEKHAEFLLHVDGGCRDVDVAEQDLHDPRIDTAFQKSGRIAMPQRMRTDLACDARRANTETEGAPQRILADRPSAEAIRTEPALVAMGQPKATQIIEHWPRQRHAALLVTLTDDPKQ